MIRCRVYDLVKHEMIYSHMATGNNTEEINPNLDEYVKLNINGNPDNYKLMECTDVYDMNGVMIYQDDLVRYYTDESTFSIGRVIKRFGSLCIAIPSRIIPIEDIIKSTKNITINIKALNENTYEIKRTEGTSECIEVLGDIMSFRGEDLPSLRENLESRLEEFRIKMIDAKEKARIDCRDTFEDYVMLISSVGSILNNELLRYARVDNIKNGINYKVLSAGDALIYLRERGPFKDFDIKLVSRVTRSLKGIGGLSTTDFLELQKQMEIFYKEASVIIYTMKELYKDNRCKRIDVF